MYESIILQEVDETINELLQRTAIWFRNNKTKAPELLFWQYLEQSTSGCFQNLYCQLLDASLECYIGVMPQLTNGLSNGVSTVISLPRLKTRRIFNITIYWLIKYHSGHRDEMPDKYEIREIYSRIIAKRTLTLW